MSIGGGFKKGKAEFAMKDIDGRDIKTATESFRHEATDKVLTVNGIDIKSTDNQYGIYFSKGETDDDPYGNIYLEGSTMHYVGDSIFENMLQIGGDLADIDGVYHSAGDKPAYLSVNRLGGARWKEVNDVHCWTITENIYTLKLYIADYTGNTGLKNLYTYFANETNDALLRKKYDKVFNITGFVMINAKTYNPVSYRIYRSGNAGSYDINIALTVIGKDSNNAVDIQSFDVKIKPISYQNGLIQYVF